MDNVEQLFIRACKSRNTYKRVYSVYRRFYTNTNDPTVQWALAGILSRICDKYLSLTTSELIGDLHPSNQWKFGVETDDSYWVAVIKILVVKIRLTERDKFPGMTVPRMFRKDEAAEPVQ